MNLACRQINRLTHIYREKGRQTLQHGNPGRKLTTAIDPHLRRTIIRLYHAQFEGYNFKHFHEKLRDTEGVSIPYNIPLNPYGQRMMKGRLKHKAQSYQFSLSSDDSFQ